MTNNVMQMDRRDVVRWQNKLCDVIDALPNYHHVKRDLEEIEIELWCHLALQDVDKRNNRIKFVPLE